MGDESRTKNELLEELNTLRRHTAELETTTSRLIKTEKELHNRNTHFQSLLEHIEEAYVEVDLVGNLTFFNKSACRLLGYDHEELPGRHYRSYTSAESVGRMHQVFSEIYRTGTSATITACELIRKNGERVIVDLSASLLRNDAGIPIGFCGIGRESTERARVEERLRNSENSYRTIFETTGTATLIIEADKTISLANKEFVKLTGLSIHEVIGRKWTEFIIGDDLERLNTYHMLRRTDPESVPRSYEFTVVDTSGRSRELLATVATIPGTDTSVASLLDITEAEQLHRALEESERKYRLLADNISDVIWIADLKLCFTYLTPSVERMLGYKSSDLLGHNVERILTTDSYNIAIRTLKEELLKDDGGKPHKKRPKTLELEQRHKNGSTVWTEVTITFLYSPAGQRLGMIGVARDISVRRRVENDLIKTKERYRAIIEDQTELVSRWQPDKKLTFVNNAYCRYFGETREDLLGVDFLHHLPVQDVKILDSHIARLNRDNPVASIEHRIINRNGEIRWQQWTDRAIMDKEGRIIEIQSVGRDITTQKDVEDALRKSERMLADIINFLPDATMAIDLEGKVIAWNRAIEEMTGVTAESILGRGNYEHALPFYGYRRPILVDLALKPDKTIEKYYVFLSKENDVLIVETDIPHLKGKQHFMWGKASPIYDQKGNVIGAIESIRDITSRKQVEESLKKREQELESKSHYLEEANTALKVLLEHRKNDKNELQENVLSNIRKFVLPYLEKLKITHLSNDQIAYLDILESNLNSVISPFFRNMTLTHFNLTPKELEVAHLIKDGKTTKEIAEILNLSPRSIDFHRLNIRHKLGLKTKKTNLRSSLLAFS